MTPTQLDPQALNLAKAIRKAETGTSTDPYNQKGASGESGAYQFMPDTWKQWAGNYLGNSNADMSIENQNKVAYSHIKELKDKGYNPAQIASMWNSGKSDAYKTGLKGINSKGVPYDVEDYTKKVSQYYNDIKNGTQSAPVGGTQFQTSVPRPEDQTVLSQLGTPDVQPTGEPSKLDYRLKQGTGALGTLSNGLANGNVADIGSGALQTVGTVAGGGLDLVDAGLNAATFGGYDAALDFFGKKVLAPVIEGLGGQKVASQWQEFATQHPDAAKNIGAIGNIVSVIPVFKSVSKAASVVGDAARAGVAKTGFVRTVEDAAKAELRASGASAPSKSGKLLSAKNIKGEAVDPVDTIVDGNYLPDVVTDPQGIPRYSTDGAISKIDESIGMDEDRLQSMLEESGQKGLVGYVPIDTLRAEAKPMIIKAFVDQGDMVDIALRKADKIFDGYQKYKGDLVPLTELNNMKRGIRKAVNFNSPQVSQDLRAQLGSMFMDTIEKVAEKQGIKDVAKINSEMAAKIRAKEALDFLNNRSVTERPGFRAALGRRSGDAATVAGEAVGQSMGMPGVGAIAGRFLHNRAVSGSGKSVVNKLKSKRARTGSSRLRTATTLGALQAQHIQEDPNQLK